MLEDVTQLHKAVAQVCPIDGIADLGHGEYRIDFASDATAEQQQAALQLAETFQPAELPLWDQFRAQILIHSAYLRIVTHNAITQTLNTALVSVLWQLSSDPSLIRDVGNLWNAIALEAQPDAMEIAALNRISAACKMPFHLNDQGLMLL